MTANCASRGTLGSKAGIIEKSGSWISFGGERIGQGRENAKLYLKQHPEVCEKIEKAIRQNAGLIVDKMLANPEGSEAADADAEPDDLDADDVTPIPKQGKGKR